MAPLPCLSVPAASPHLSVPGQSRAGGVGEAPAVDLLPAATGSARGAERADRGHHRMLPDARRAPEALRMTVIPPPVVDEEAPVIEKLSTLDRFLPLWIGRSEGHTSELQSLMRISYAVLGLKKQ